LIEDHSLRILYSLLMRSQYHGLCTEYHLLDAARYFWYDGYETNERMF